MADARTYAFPSVANDNASPRPLRDRAFALAGLVKMKPGVGNFTKGIVGIAVAIMAWELIRWFQIVDPRDLPSFSVILQTAFEGLSGGELARALLATLGSWLPGLLLATAVGITAGIALALSPQLEMATRPLLEFLRPIPSVALIPVALMVLGIGLQMQLFMIAFASVWPVLFSAKAGVESVDPRYLETGRALGLGGAERMLRIVVPSTLPFVATGLRTASAIALVLAITVEMLTGRPGIGFYIENVRLNGLVTEMWAAIFVAGVLGYLVNALFMAIERIALPWSPENRDR
jgi:ABC-type nitrate/sulfonate/bicarbonate transport system permease component